MKWLKENWKKIIQFIVVGFLLYCCSFFLYSWFKFNGSIGDKLFNLFITVIMIYIFLFIFAVDFHGDIIKWYKKNFKNDHKLD